MRGVDGPRKSAESAGVSVCMIQIGARLHYGAAAAIAEHGMLAALLTDATSESRDLRSVWNLLRTVAPKAHARLMGRVVPIGIDRSRLHSYLLPSIQIRMAEMCGLNRAKSARWNYELGIGGHWLSKLAIREEFFGANALYVHPCVSTSAIRAAKRQGVKVILEAISHPQNKRVEMEECDRFGTTCDQSAELIRDNIGFFRDEAIQADLVLAASPYVRDGLIELGLPEMSIRTVRYGLDPGFAAGFEAAPQLGRVLFVGAVNWLKGVPYLAQAAKVLGEKKLYQFDVVGPLGRGVAGHSAFEGPTYHGQVPRSFVRKYFERADVFVFPTLSDGFGLVLLEAMAAGLPVISTANCADLVEDGVNGFIVPMRDGRAIADRIQLIVGDRCLRERMSRAARATAARYTLQDYGRQLVAAVSQA